ncbi:MAG: B12-binding domain-containing radical SAM protein [Verrucomicrobia bacterium]|nr:B12-binding domain-containing radical SAM protein [Verrucomicrobiota bacterium]
MKILLVYPNLFGMNMLPPAIGILNSCLLREGHQTALFDTTTYSDWGSLDSDKLKEERLNARPFDDRLLRQNEKHGSPTEDFRWKIREFSPDLLAFSVTEDMYPNALELLRALDKRDRPKVVAGGVFPTFAPELALRKADGMIDYLLTGEGETTLPELCRRLESGREVASIPSICFLKKDGSFHRNPLPVVLDPNDVPLPNYNFFEESRFYRPMQGKVWRMFPVETIRGCPYTCAYCNSPSQIIIHQEAKQKFFRKTRVQRIKDQLVYLRERYKPDSFYFWADTFLAVTDAEFEEFCDMYSEFKLPFWIQTRPETVTRHKFKRLKEAGILRVAFGVEHGNERFREKVLLRRIDNETIVNNLNILHELGVPFSVNNIMGFPRENRELAFDTIDLNRRIRSDGMNAYSFTPFHGTPLRTMAELLGYVKPGEITRSIMKPTMLRMPHWSKEEIEGLRRCFVIYVKLPKSRWSEVRKAEELTPEGDRVWDELRQEVLENFMHWGDRNENDDAGKIELEKDDFKINDAAEASILGMVDSRYKAMLGTGPGRESVAEPSMATSN